MTDLREAVAEAQKTRDDLMEARAELNEQLNAILAEMEPLRAKEREIRAAIKELQTVHLYPIQQGLADAAKAAGGRVLKAE